MGGAIWELWLASPEIQEESLPNGLHLWWNDRSKHDGPATAVLTLCAPYAYPLEEGPRSYHSQPSVVVISSQVSPAITTPWILLRKALCNGRSTGQPGSGDSGGAKALLAPAKIQTKKRENISSSSIPLTPLVVSLLLLSFLLLLLLPVCVYFGASCCV